MVDEEGRARDVGDVVSADIFIRPEDEARIELEEGEERDADVDRDRHSGGDPLRPQWGTGRCCGVVEVAGG